MFLRRYLTSLRNTYLFMVCFGLLMGLVFPFYSSLFFGSKAFTPLYAIGCLAAGFAVGSFCFLIIKQVLRLHVERQHQAIALVSHRWVPEEGDELEALIAYDHLILERILSMAGNVSGLINHLTPLHDSLARKYHDMAETNEVQSAKVRETLRAVGELNGFITVLLGEIDELSQRIEQGTSMSTQMSATIDLIGENMQSYSSSVEETSASVEEMATHIKGNADAIQGLASSTEQTVRSIARVGEAISKVRDNAQKAADSSEGVRLQAQGGLLYMATTLKAMQEIEKTNEESFDAINRLSIHSARVGEFLNVIQEVVEQTNLLSLNASIIAAQAGERGKAFAIVAEEVRSLAQRTSLSAKEIGDLVKNIQKETAAVQRSVTQGKSRVKDGVKISRQTNDALVKIESGAAEASEMVKRIATATVEQASQSRLIGEEAEKNLQRVNTATAATKKQETAIGALVQSLEQMRALSKKISVSIQEQVTANRLYQRGMEDENDRVGKLKEAARVQLRMGQDLQEYVAACGGVIEGNATESREMMRAVEEVSRLTTDLKAETTPFTALRQPPEE